MTTSRAVARSTILAVLVLASGTAVACTNGPRLDGGCVVAPCGPPNVGDISGILPSSASLAVGDSLFFFVYTSRPLVWSVDDTAIGTVTQAGLFRARSAGATRVVAIDTGLSNLRRTAAVSVHAP